MTSCTLGPEELQLLEQLPGTKLAWIYATRLLVIDGVVTAPRFYLDFRVGADAAFLVLEGSHRETDFFVDYSSISLGLVSPTLVVPDGKVVLLDNLSALKCPSLSPVRNVLVFADSYEDGEEDGRDDVRADEPHLEFDACIEIVFADDTSLWFGPAPLGLDGLGVTVHAPQFPDRGFSRRLRMRL